MVKAREILEAQVCDSCHVKRATAYCELDCAFLCDRCDAVFHDNDSEARNHVRICTTAGVLEAYSGPRKPYKRNTSHSFTGDEVFLFETISSELGSGQDEKLADFYSDETATLYRNACNGRQWTSNTFEELSPTDSLVPEYPTGDDHFCRLFLRDDESTPEDSGEVGNYRSSTPDFGERSLSSIMTPSSVGSIISEDQTMISDISESGKDSLRSELNFGGHDSQRARREEDEETYTGTKAARRRIALERFRQKRSNRCFQKKIRYACRKRLADVRPRIRGRFVKKEEFQTLCLETGDATVPTVY